MRADHNEVVTLSDFANNLSGITPTDIRRSREPWTIQGLGCAIDNLPDLESTFLVGNIRFDHPMLAGDRRGRNHGEDREGHGVLEGMRDQPRLQTGGVLRTFYSQKDLGDRTSCSFDD